MTKPPTDPDRHVLGRYRLTDRLAVGGSAEVWRARDEQLDRDVAVKLLHPHLLPDARSRARLTAEARAVAGLTHPGIVAVYDVDADGEIPGVVLELVDGESLATRLARDGALPEREAARITAEVAEALFHAHRRGVIHRDVKPGNILLAGADGRARLVDFGIARMLDEAAARLTMTGTVMGTLRYMAPEQLAGGAIGPRTDLWGLGAVLHEMLTGQPPFAAATPVALVDAQRSGVAELHGIDPALAEVVRTCLAVDPGARPLHAGAAAAALRAWLAGEPAPAPVVDPDAVTAAVPAVAAPEASRTPPPRGRRTAPSWALIGALMLAVVLIAAVVMDRAPGEPPADAGSSGTTLTQAASGIPTPTASPTPVPTVDIGTLPKPVRDEVERYREACGADAPLPENLGAMNKREVEAHFAPLIAACEAD